MSRAEPAPDSRTPATPGVFREALRLSIPSTLSLLLHAGYRVNDQYWVKDLGVDAQAALGVSSFMLIFNFAFVTLVSTGALARVARSQGAGQRESLQQAYGAAQKFGLFWFTLIGILGWFTTRYWIGLLGAQAHAAELSVEYLERIYLCFPLVALKPMTDSIWIGLGNTMIPMLLSLLSVGLNFVLNPLLIYGYGPFPEWGIGGAAWATGIARGVSSLISIVLLSRYQQLRFRWREGIDWSEVRRMLAIGIPMAISTGAYAGVFIGVLKTTIEPFGRVTQAGLGVAFNGVEGISFCGLMGPAMAVSGMVGRALGAGSATRARQSIRACLTLSCGIAGVTTLAFLLIPRQLAGFYSDDPQVLTEGALYLWIVAWSQTATAAQMVFEQALAGAGHTLGMSVFNILSNGVRIPLCWFLAHPLGYGPAGAWWAMNLSNYLRLSAIVLIYLQGRWASPTQTSSSGPTDADPPPVHTPTTTAKEPRAGSSGQDSSERLSAHS